MRLDRFYAERRATLGYATVLLPGPWQWLACTRTRRQGVFDRCETDPAMRPQTIPELIRANERCRVPSCSAFDAFR